MSSYFDDDDYESDKSSSDSEEEYINPSSISKKEIKIIEDDSDDEPAQFGGVADFPEEDDIDEDDVEEDDLANIEEDPESLRQKIKQIPENAIYNKDEDEDEDDDEGTVYLNKFDKEINQNYIMNFHPECILQNYDEI